MLDDFLCPYESQPRTSHWASNVEMTHWFLILTREYARLMIFPSYVIYWPPQTVETIPLRHNSLFLLYNTSILLSLECLSKIFSFITLLLGLRHGSPFPGV